MRSMTGFGQATVETTRGRVHVTIRAVNARFLDLVVRLPRELEGREQTIRERLAGELRRGRVELAVSFEPAAGESRLDLDTSALRELAGVLDVLRAELLGQGLVSADPPSICELLAARDLVRSPPATAGKWSEPDLAALDQALASALAALITHREREGASLSAALADRLAALGTVRAELAAAAATMPATLQAELSRRIGELVGTVNLPAERLATEVALLVDRYDVREELDRLGAHLAHAGELLVARGEIGKRLDFLVQEIHRELSTLGAKSRDLTITRGVLDAKQLNEQIREQVQNVE